MQVAKRNLYKENKKIARKRLSEAHSWDDFSDPETDQIEKEYLPAEGEGENMMSQAVTAACKLIYKWFNDGDVFDNNYGLEGWANDLSSYANWLAENIPETVSILERIETIGNDKGAYTDLLYDLMKAVFNSGMVTKYAGQPKTGTVYNCDGPYSFHEAITCPECGGECDDWDYNRYGMCGDCYRDQQYNYDDYEEEYDESVKNNRKRRVTESEDDNSEKDFTEEDAVAEAFPYASEHTVDIIARWYKNEGLIDDFDTLQDFAEHISSNFIDMFQASDYDDDELHEIATDLINAGYYEEDDFPFHYRKEEFDESVKGKRALFKESETADVDEYDSGSTLSDYQKDVIRDMVKCDFECGYVSDPSDSSLREVFEEDPDFEGVVDEALSYYGVLAEYLREEGEGEEGEEGVEHDMGEMYGAPHGASSEYALKYFENKKLTRKALQEARVAKSEQPTLDNMISIMLKDFKDAGFDLEKDKSVQDTAQNKKTAQLKGVFGEGIDGTIRLELDSRSKYKIIPDIDGIDFDLEGKGMASFKEDSRDLAEACMELESKRIIANDKNMREDWDYE